MASLFHTCPDVVYFDPMSGQNMHLGFEEEFGTLPRPSRPPVKAKEQNEDPDSSAHEYTKGIWGNNEIKHEGNACRG